MTAPDPGDALGRASSPSPVHTGEELGTTTGRTIIRGGLWSLLARVAPQLQVLALSIAIARFLGPSDMGRQSFISFVAISVALVATAGLPTALSRFVGRSLGSGRRGAARTLYGWVWRIEVAAAIAATAGLVLAAALGASPATAWVLAGVATGLAIVQSAPAALLAGAQRWREATIVGVLTGLASVPLTILVLALDQGIAGVFAVEAAIAVVNLAWTALFARRLVLELPPEADRADDLRPSFLRYAWLSTIFIAIELVIWRRSEFLFLDRYSADAEIALYSIAFAAVTGLTRIPEAVTKVTLPAVATLEGAEQGARIRTGFWRALRLLSFATPVTAALAAALGPDLVTLAYGDAYAEVGAVLLVLLIPLPLLPLMTMSSAVLWALGQLRFLLLAGLVATAVNLALDVVLIPRHDALGAAWANIGAQLAFGTPVMLYAARQMGRPDLGPRVLARGAAVAAAAGLAAWVPTVLIDGIAGPGAGLAAGAATFWVLGGLIGILDARDALWLDEATGELAGGRVGRVVRHFAARPVTG